VLLLKAYLERILDDIDGKELIDLLRGLIRIPSPSGEEQEIAEYIANKMENIGLSVELIGGNVVGRTPSIKGAPTIVLNGHMDTVPIGNRSAWTVDPLGAEVRNGRIFGRGAADMKGGLASIIMAVEALQRSGISVKGNIMVTAVALEEVPMKLIGRRGVVELLDRNVIKGEAVIIGEPTGLRVSIGHRSKAEIVVVTYGKSAHASMPEMGVNAIEKMTKIVSMLKKLEFGYHEALGSGTINIGVIEGGIKSNVVPDVCKLKIDRRLTIGETPEKATEEIKEVVRRLAEGDRDLNAEVSCTYGWLPTLISEKEPIVQALIKASEIVMGKRLPAVVSRFHSDGGFIHHMTGLPIVLFGPGNESQAHTVDEYVEIAQVMNAAKIYAVAIASFIGIVWQQD